MNGPRSYADGESSEGHDEDGEAKHEPEVHAPERGRLVFLRLGLVVLLGLLDSALPAILFRRAMRSQHRDTASRRHRDRSRADRNRLERARARGARSARLDASARRRGGPDGHRDGLHRARACVEDTRRDDDELAPWTKRDVVWRDCRERKAYEKRRTTCLQYAQTSRRRYGTPHRTTTADPLFEFTQTTHKTRPSSYVVVQSRVCVRCRVRITRDVITACPR